MTASLLGYFINISVTLVVAWFTLPLWSKFIGVSDSVAICSLLYLMFFSAQQMAHGLF